MSNYRDDFVLSLSNTLIHIEDKGKRVPGSRFTINLITHALLRIELIHQG